MVRPSKGGNEYEMPVEGDWVIIGVLAEKSEIRMTGSTAINKANIEARKKKSLEGEKAKKQNREENKDAQDDMMDYQAKSDDELKEAGEDSDQEKTYANKQQPRRYISFKLLDLKHRNASGGQGLLNLRLFESDSQRKSKKEDDSSSDETLSRASVKMTNEKELLIKRRPAKEYKGGSGGAYEKFWKEREGTVIAILNPKIMKPWTVRRHGPPVIRTAPIAYYADIAHLLCLNSPSFLVNQQTTTSFL